MSKRYCVNGHDTAYWGRRRNSGQCVKCHRITSNLNKNGVKTVHVPYAPVVPYLPRWEAGVVDGYGPSARNALPDKVQRAIYRGARAGGFTVAAADEIACALGMHPFEIWGSDWWTVEVSA